MKSKFVLTLFLVGVLPIMVLAGVYYSMACHETQVSNSPAGSLSTNAPQTTIPMVQTQLSTISSTLKTAIEGTYQNISGLVANHSDGDLDNFVKSHPGLQGVAVLTMDGKLQKTIPPTAQLVDPNYSASEEFQKMISKFKENGGKTDLFYTQRLNYPAFIFSVPLDSKTIVQAVLNLSYFFPAVDTKNGDLFLLDSETGQYFYHSNASKLHTLFNQPTEKWLTDVQNGLKAKQSSSVLNPPVSAAIYSYLGIKAIGIVEIIPFSTLQPPAPISTPVARAGAQRLQQIIQSPTGFVVGIAAVASFGWIFLVGFLCLGMILKPLRKASGLVLNAAHGSGELSAKSVQEFGEDEVGQMVQSVSLLMKKLDEDKKQANQENEETLRRGRLEVEAKSKEAATQISAAQQAAASAKDEANEKNQQLNEKLKELDALKSMSEGLRAQTDQAKTETAKWKGQTTTAEEGKAEAQKKLTQAQSQLKEMEGKLLSVVASSSPVQVSQVRAAAIRTMAEELKTTLGIIKGYVSSALGATQGGINEKQQEFLGMVINRSARLEKFINDLVDIYQVEIEQATAQFEDVNLASEIEGLAFNFQSQAEVKNIKMKVDTIGVIPNIPIVRRRFTQLWNILYLQIIKDAPRGSNVPIALESIGDNVKVTVHDPGLVVVPESLPRLFDEFYDPKHPASPQLAGTGLKFALVKTILSAHGGGAVAEKGEPGTQLILTFPTKIKKPGEVLKTVSPIGASASIPPKSPSPGLGINLPKPGIAPIGIPKPLGSIPSSPGIPASKPSTPGLLDSLISKVSSVPPPVVKPSVPGGSLSPLGPKPLGLGTPPPVPTSGPVNPPPTGATAPLIPGFKTPSATSNLLDSLMEKKSSSPAPPTPEIPKVGGPPITPLTPIGIPKPSAPPMFGIPGISSPGAPKPPLPVVPPMAIKPPIPPMTPSMGIPGMAGATPPPPVAPKVIPNSLKPTTPPQGILDLDNMDGMKLNDGLPKPPIVNAPAPPSEIPKPYVPGIIPTGLDASKPMKSKDAEGELIE